jgi:hypothetical protein
MPRMGTAILHLSIFLAVLGAVALQQQQPPAAPPNTATTDLSDSIYTLAVQEHVNHVGEGPKPGNLVFRASTVPLPCFDNVEEHCPDLVKKELEKDFANRAESETIQDLIAQNKSEAPLSTTFHTDLPRVFITDEEVDSYFKSPQKKDGWESFYKKYPKSGGMLSFSRVGFNAKRDQALVYSANSCGWLCGAGFYNLFQKKDGKWVLALSYMAWIS